MVRLWLVSLAMLYVIGVQAAARLSPETALVRDILSMYRMAGFRHTIPVANISETETVKFGIALIQVKSLDERTGQASFMTWWRYTWSDAYLKWNPKKYGGISHVRLPAHRLWRPDLRLYNSLSVKLDQAYDTLAVVTYDGKVLWIPPTEMRVTCVKGKKSSWTCPFNIGSWTYDGNRLDLEFFDNKEKMDVSSYAGPQNWVLVYNVAKKRVKYYPCCKEPYPTLHFLLAIRKR